MKLKQGQTWKHGGVYLRIVTLERLSVKYKEFTNTVTRKGEQREVTKKEFCRLIKGAELVVLEKKKEAD